MKKQSCDGKTTDGSLKRQIGILILILAGWIAADQFLTGWATDPPAKAVLAATVAIVALVLLFGWLRGIECALRNPR